MTSKIENRMEIRSMHRMQKEAEEARRRLGKERLVARGIDQQPLDETMESEEHDLETKLREIYIVMDDGASNHFG